MRTNNVPSLVMLSAGLVDCIIGTSKHMEVIPFLKQLAIVLLIFYIIGVVIKIILDKAIKAFADTPEKKEDKNENVVDDESTKVEEKK